jgi:hypothetical protein
LFPSVVTEPPPPEDKDDDLNSPLNPPQPPKPARPRLTYALVFEIENFEAIRKKKVNLALSQQMTESLRQNILCDQRFYLECMEAGTWIDTYYDCETRIPRFKGDKKPKCGRNRARYHFYETEQFDECDPKDCAGGV